MCQIEDAFIKTYNIQPEEYRIENGVLHFHKMETLVKCNIFGMGWILGKQEHSKNDSSFQKEMFDDMKERLTKEAL